MPRKHVPAHMVPTEPVARLVEMYIERSEGPDIGPYDSDTVKVLSLKTGLHIDTIVGIIERNNPRMHFATADKLVCSIGLGYLAWRRPELRPFYWPPGGEPPDCSKPLKCKNPKCDKWFELDSDNHKSWGRLYCSENCKWRHVGQTKDPEKKRAARRAYHERNRERRLAYFRERRKLQKEMNGSR